MTLGYDRNQNVSVLDWAKSLIGQVNQAFAPSQTTQTNIGKVPSGPSVRPVQTSTPPVDKSLPPANPVPLDRYTEQMKQMPVSKPQAVTGSYYDVFNPGGSYSGGTSTSKDYGYDNAPKSYSSGSSYSSGGGGYAPGSVSTRLAPMPAFHAKAPAAQTVSPYQWKPGDPANIGPITEAPAPYVRDRARYAKLLGGEV